MQIVAFLKFGQTPNFTVFIYSCTVSYRADMDAVAFLEMDTKHPER